MDKFCVVRNYGTKDEEILACGLTDIGMLRFVNDNLKEENDRLTVCLENATEQEAAAWCKKITEGVKE